MKKITNLTAEDANSIYNLKQVKKGIEDLENFEWPKHTDTENIDDFTSNINNILTSKLGSLPSLVQLVSQKTINFPIFRAREVFQVGNVHLFAEFSYPPVSFTQMGRCNFPKHPVFYASNSPLTAMLEVFRESEYRHKELYLSSWSIIPSDEILYFESFLKSGLNDTSFYNRFNKNLKGKINKTFEGLVSQQQTLGMVEYLKYLDKQFITDKSYSLSASLAHRRLHARGNYGSDIIMYPSVQSKGNDANLAINPNFVDNNMRLNRIYKVSLQNYDLKTNTYSLTFHAFAQVSKNALVWTENMHDSNFKNALVKDFKSYKLPT